MQPIYLKLCQCWIKRSFRVYHYKKLFFFSENIKSNTYSFVSNGRMYISCKKIFSVDLFDSDIQILRKRQSSVYHSFPSSSMRAKCDSNQEYFMVYSNIIKRILGQPSCVQFQMSFECRLWLDIRKSIQIATISHL